MKRKEMLQGLLFFIFLLAYGIASAQDYVVTTSLDTIRGKVKYFNNSSVQFKAAERHIQITSDQGKKSIHKVLQTVSFRMKGEVYHTIKFDDGYLFMKLLRRGYLNLYSYQLENQTTWDGRYLVKLDGALLDIPNLGFKKKVAAFVADCPEVKTKVESGDLNKTNLIKLVDEYNACINLKSAPVARPGEDLWRKLETEVHALPNFDKKSDALEIINDIKGKVSRKEAVPSYLQNSLKDALKDQPSVKKELDAALENIADH